MNQNEIVLHHLRTMGSITPLEAIGVYRIFRLAARIRELRQMGYNITTIRKKDASGKHYACYMLKSFAHNVTLGAFLNANDYSLRHSA